MDLLITIVQIVKDLLGSLNPFRLFKRDYRASFRDLRRQQPRVFRIGYVLGMLCLLVLLVLLALVGHGDCVGLMPLQIASHPAAAPFMTVVPVKEGHLDLTLGAIVRNEIMLKPAVRHLLAHLHRAAQQAGGPR